MRKILTMLIFLTILIPLNSGCSKGGREMLFTIKGVKETYLLGEKMPMEVEFKNNTKYPIKLYKNFHRREDWVFRLKLSEKHLTPYLLAKIDPHPLSLVTLKPGEKYRDKIDIAKLVNELELKPGTYNIQLVYTMWVLTLKEKPEYVKDRTGKTNREWESNEIKITIK